MGNRTRRINRATKFEFKENLYYLKIRIKKNTKRDSKKKDVPGKPAIPSSTQAKMRTAIYNQWNHQYPCIKIITITKTYRF